MGVSRLEYAYLDCITQSEKILSKDSNEKLFNYINVWNNQIKRAIEGKSYVFSSPSLFLEINLGKPMQIGAGFISYPECIIRIHIYHVKLDNQDESLDRNFEVFNLRDSVLTHFNNSGNIRYCSKLMSCEDEQDFDHTSVYHYLLGFKTNFIDNRGSIDDPDSGRIKAKLTNPTLNINVFKKWDSNESYFLNNIVSYQSVQYRCINDNQDSEFNESNWSILKDWEPLTSYTQGDYVAYYSSLYLCKNDNEDSDFTIANWEIKNH